MAGTDSTDTAATRWRYTNDILATVLIVTFVGYVFSPVALGLQQYPDTNAVVLGGFVAGFGIAVAWAFGSEAVQAWRKYREDNE